LTIVQQNPVEHSPSLGAEPTGRPTSAATRRDEVLAVRDGGVENRLFVSRWSPSGTSRGTVLCIHSLTTTRLDYEAMAEALSDRGLTVVCPDMIGHGRSRWTGSAAEMGPGGPCGGENIARCLAGLLQHYAADPGSRYLIGSSWGAIRLALFLARRRVPARRVVFNDVSLERHPLHGVMLQRISADAELSFDTLDEGIAFLETRQRELLRNQDSDSIAPALLRRYTTSQLTVQDGRFVIASNPFREGISRKLQLGYPDLYAALSAIAAERILLLYGSRSPYRDSATQHRLMQTLPNVRSAEVPNAGHPPRLLTPYEWNLLADFLLEP
jgi:pimeloyl-ACP methyl ester carboxylesterase